MSSGVIYDPPRKILTIFNPSDWEYLGDTELTYDTADARYLRLDGGTEQGPVLFNKGFNTSANVGVNTTSATRTLTVNGDVGISGNVYIDGNTLFVDATNNYVGINNSVPTNKIDIDGNINLSSGGSIRIATGAVLTAGNLGTCSIANNLPDIRSTNHTANTGQGIGATNIVNTTNNGGITPVGTFSKWVGWSSANTTHIIIEATFYYNAGNDNAGVNFLIFCSNKSTTNPKFGIMNCSILKSSGYNPDTFVRSVTKTSNLTTFSLGISLNNLSVTTDSDCRVCFLDQGAI